MSEQMPLLPRHLLFVLIKPDAIVSGKTHALLDALHAAGLRIAAWHRIAQPHESQFEELYRFNLAKRALGTEPVGWWLNRRLYTMDESLALLVQTARTHASPGELMTALKGPSHPWLCQPGQLRHTFCASNLAMNLIHSSDDANATAREAYLFGEPMHWQGALPNLDAEITQADALHARHRHALDQINVWRQTRADMHPLRVAARCAARLIGLATDLHVLAELHALANASDAQLQAGRAAYWQRLEDLAQRVMEEVKTDTANAAVLQNATQLLRVRHTDWLQMEHTLQTCSRQAEGPDKWEQLVLLSTAYHRNAMFAPAMASPQNARVPSSHSA